MVLYYIFLYFAWNSCIKLVPHQLTVILGLMSTKAVFWKNLYPENPVMTGSSCRKWVWVESHRITYDWQWVPVQVFHHPTILRLLVCRVDTLLGFLSSLIFHQHMIVHDRSLRYGGQSIP